VLVTFCVLVLGGTAGGCAMLRAWSDETWGSRYLHVTVVPLILCLGLTVRTFGVARKLALTAAGVLGLWIWFLGSFSYYGNLHGVAMATDQSTLEVIQTDLIWNHIGFNARLFTIWWSGSRGEVIWTPSHQWWPARPPSAPEWKRRASTCAPWRSPSQSCCAAGAIRRRVGRSWSGRGICCV
jgi:hypothetical protein